MREMLSNAVRKELSLNGLRSNAELVPSPPLHRKLQLKVSPKHKSLFPHIEELMHSNGTPNAAALCTKYAIPIKSDGLAEWIRHQKDYVNALSLRDRHILSSYTKYGDTLVNNFVRGTLRDLSDFMDPQC